MQGVAVVGDRLGEPSFVAVPVAELALEAEPAGALGARCELAEQDGLAGSAEPGQRPVRMGRMRLAEEALELGEQRGHAPPGTAGQRRSLGGTGSRAVRFGLWLGLSHVVYPLS